MSEESRKDDILESTEKMTTANNDGGVGGAGNELPEAANAYNSSTAFGSAREDDDGITELASEQMLPAPDAKYTGASVSSQPPERKNYQDIPMARISVMPVTKVEILPYDELFELQEGHVVEEGNVPSDKENDKAGPGYDLGTPEVVFDTHTVADSIASAAASAAEMRSAQLPDASPPEGQPMHAVAVNQPLGDSSVNETGSRSSYPGLTEAQKGKLVSVEDMTKAVFDDVPPEDDGPRESTLDGYVGYMNSESSGPAMASPEEMFPGAPVSDTGAALEVFDAAEDDEDADEDLDIDITEEVEEVVDANGAAAAGSTESGVQKLPPPPPPPGGGRPVSSFFKNDKIDAANASLKLAAKTSRKSRGKKKEWWGTIFDDEYLMLLPERSLYEQQKQIDFIQRYLGLPPGALLLDLACGNGRNAIGMAQRNYRIVGVDLSLSMLARAGDAAQEAGQKINFIHGDMRDLGFDKTFDGVFSLDTSFGYFDEPSNMKVLQGIYRALKPGGTFLLELANRDFVIRQQPNMVWFQMDNMVCMEETDFNYINNRLYISRQLIIGDNEKQSKHEFSLRLYSLHEIGQLLHQAGFAVIKVSGHRATPGAFFGPESSKLIIIAERRGE